MVFDFLSTIKFIINQFFKAMKVSIHFKKIFCLWMQYPDFLTLLRLLFQDTSLTIALWKSYKISNNFLK